MRGQDFIGSYSEQPEDGVKSLILQSQHAYPEEHRSILSREF